MTQPQSDLVTVTIDGVAIQVPKGTLLVEAAKQIDRYIPVYCYHTKLGPAGLCRICLVEIEGMPKLQIACNTTVADGMVVHTESGKSNEGRRAVLELLLLNHPLDCPICDKGGECDLQDFSMAYGQGASRLADPKTSKPKAVDLGPTIVLDEERCILCLRCVRFDDVITHERSLRTDDRGVHAIIATATGEPYVSDFSGNTTELCPVGALTSKTYRFRSRPWDNHRTTTTCTQCSVGCQQHVDQRAGRIMRTMMVEEDEAVSGGWLCDRGRYNIGYVDDERRITQPLLRSGDAWLQIGWDDAIALWAQALRETSGEHGAIGGGRLLNEEAYLLQHIYRTLGIENIDWRTGRQRTALPGPPGTPDDLEHAQVILTFGRTPAQLAPVLDLRIRKAVTMGALVIAVGDHAAGGFLPGRRVATFAEAQALFPADATRFALLSDAQESGAGDDVAAWIACASGLTFHSYVLGEQPNARGAESVGMFPRDGGRDTQAMLEAARDGKMASLALLGVNPMLHWPDRALVEAALAATPFVVVSELFLTETAARANLVLPACGAFEKSGTTTNLTGDVLPVVASLAAPAGVLADGDMLVALADALGVTLPLPDEIDATVRELVAAAKPPASIAPVTLTAGEGPLRVVVESRIFTGGGTLAHDPRLPELIARPRARMHPHTAAALGLIDGALIDVTDGAGNALRGLLAVVDERMPEGTVGLLDGVPTAPLNVLRTARVTAALHVPERELIGETA